MLGTPVLIGFNAIEGDQHLSVSASLPPVAAAAAANPLGTLLAEELQLRRGPRVRLCRGWTAALCSAAAVALGGGKAEKSGGAHTGARGRKRRRNLLLLRTAGRESHHLATINC